MGAQSAEKLKEQLRQASLARSMSRSTESDLASQHSILKSGFASQGSVGISPKKAVKMSGSGNYQEFQTVEMRKELEESNKENSDAGSASGPNSTTAPPSASKTMLYPRPYADPYNSRKYFATRPGAFDQAMDDLKAHVMSNMGETAHSFWLLAEVDHWNNEKERVAVITGSALLICKYDFIMLKCLQLQRIPLSYINSVCLGSFTFPERSLDKLCFLLALQ
ncbi:tumor protein p63-regulated gene 1 protein-like isoform X3 [Rhineura floridana]|uniref:tumor protein p63-regulated gene 1 protein-like isoform X3 n=2 Tax=Rhineura floridana TaxID=261503 RepID=UPI002AC88FD1|nr:tumor protein p63-regulated gene 1 protein-like isoform X3 [Rhineura floridana]